MSSRYFKLISTFEGMEDWVAAEFFAGRARYGWSPPGADLRGYLSGVKPWEDWPEDIRWAWSPSQFLIRRLQVGDRIVMQTRQPLREFLIGEVVSPGYDFDGTQNDFNHILHVRPLVSKPVSVNSSLVPEFLKHDLSKRGRYYEIYPERSIVALDELVARAATAPLALTTPRSERDAFDRAREDSRSQLAKVISGTWPAEQFEDFCQDLLKRLPYVEVKTWSDTGQGWDMKVQFVNPITGAVLIDEVPVQCKNYVGQVLTQRPIDDLERCVRNSGATRAMLLIMGDLTEEYLQQIAERAAKLTEELRREIVFEVVDQDRIAEMYAATLGLDDSGDTETGKAYDPVAAGR